ncbi:carboxymuconolactone decarboxylase family protein [Ramlibacter sp. PS4R-6]|uniref:carboxymuconolactone decarboxylase family protein n=1 Tax=Ramlibacter sp. PS4R-6 TaxID=3133438 RepID=UPI0030AC1116
MSARIPPATPPFDPEVAATIDRVMRGQPPLHLFATMARDPRLARKFFAGGLLDKGHLTVRQREIVIDRTTALCGAEYEWGVHIAGFAQKAELTAEQVRSTVHGTAEDACWSDEDRLLVRLCDALHKDCDVDDDLWKALRATFSENAIVELLMLAGFYRTVSYLTNALRIPLESYGARFPK